MAKERDPEPLAGPVQATPEAIAVALRDGVGQVVRRMRQVRAEGELTLPERSALARLDRGGPATSAELARQEQISPQSMGATLAALRSRGLVERGADPTDGRRVVLSVTEAGAEVLRDRRSARAELLAQALAAEFDQDELERLAAALPLLARLARRL